MKKVNEKLVMDFFLEQLSQDRITFLVNRPAMKDRIRSKILLLENSDDLHEKILIAKDLWKLLFESAMTFIDSNKRGYDTLFSYFDAFVNFEELIFASDSFYRDHTLHCLWVYFLGEYLFKSPEFQPLWQNFNREFRNLERVKQIVEQLDSVEVFEPLIKTIEMLVPINRLEDSIRCVIALTHDLGYPLKKIEKINKSIKKILPFFAVFNIEEFKFQFDATQQFYISKFLELLGYELFINPPSNPLDFESIELVKHILEKLNQLLMSSLSRKTISNEQIQQIRESLRKLSPKQIYILNHCYRLNGRFEVVIPRMLRFSDDFEKFKHGIMSSFLLLKLLNAFSSIDIHYTELSDIPIEIINLPSMSAKLEILKAIANHTSSGYRVKNFDNYSSFLILIDEIEEFSRISRANQFRQFVNEFCSTAISFDNGCLTINFIFDNKNIADLNPELAFKNKALRFLRLFDISDFDHDIKIRFVVTSKLPSKEGEYELVIARKNFHIFVNGIEQEITSYLGTSETF